MPGFRRVERVLAGSCATSYFRRYYARYHVRVALVSHPPTRLVPFERGVAVTNRLVLTLSRRGAAPLRIVYSVTAVYRGRVVAGVSLFGPDLPVRAQVERSLVVLLSSRVP